MNIPEQPVFTFWTGPKSPLIDLCFESMHKHLPNLVVLSAEDWDKLWVNDRDLPTDIPWYQMTDFMRYTLLKQYGGAWLDADLLVFRPFGDLFQMLSEYDLICYGDNGAALFSQPNGKVVNVFYDEAVRRLKAGRYGRGHPRGSTGPQFIKHLVPELKQQGHRIHHYTKKWFELPRSGWRGVQHRTFLKRGTDAEHARLFFSHAFTCHLSAKCVSWFDNMTRGQLLASNTFMGYLCRRALGDS